MSKAREYWIDIEKRDPLESNTYVNFDKCNHDGEYFETVHVREVLPDEVSDSAMLDWLIANNAKVVQEGADAMFFVIALGSIGHCSYGKTPRDAIRAAMQKEGK